MVAVARAMVAALRRPGEAGKKEDRVVAVVVEEVEAVEVMEGVRELEGDVEVGSPPPPPPTPPPPPPPLVA